MGLTLHAPINNFRCLDSRPVNKPVVAQHHQNLVRMDNLSRHERQITDGHLLQVEKTSHMNVRSQTFSQLR